ncbi:MAG: hypothetical protein IH608_02695 [Proteobacteria bacterium]|nr:hypothetical protein [Pseudomonadota bacterium]
MNGFRLVLGAAALCAVALPAPTAHAFHEGGAGYCDGCHDLHGEEAAESSHLLLGADPSSTCLRCHGERGQFSGVLSTSGAAHTPGGDFYWLRKTYSWSNREGAGSSPGERHGHNVAAAGYGLEPDGTLSTAPGGSYPAALLSCVSCHDPHGKASGTEAGGDPVSVSGSYGAVASEGTTSGTFRLLGGVGYKAGAGAVFTAEAPIARAPSDWEERDDNHTAYGTGMSEWCGNCHRGLLAAAAGGTKHPAGPEAKLGTATASVYNAYVCTGYLTGNSALAYLALVPFETGAVDSSSLDPSRTAGPDAEASVMCLTCHRAHASAFNHAGRWDFSATFLAESHPLQSDSGASAQDERNSYYGRDLIAEFGAYQRSLCNKCHALD